MILAALHLLFWLSLAASIVFFACLRVGSKRNPFGGGK
jgi:hypothetical protein